MSSSIKIVQIPTRDGMTTVEVDTSVPTTGSGWAAKAVEIFNDRHGTAAAVLFDNSPGGLGQFTVEAAPVANTVVTKRYFFTRAARATRLALFVASKPASVAGSVLLTLKKNGSTTVLSAANYNTEGLTDATYTAMTLTATTADLEFAAGDFLEIVHTSNNGDMTAGTGFVVIGEYELV